MAAELKIGIGADNSGLNKGLQDAERQITAFVSKIEKIANVGEQLSSIGQKMSVGLTLPILALGGSAIKAYGDIQSLQKGLEAVMGSTGAATKEFEKLKEVARLPGLGMEEAVRGSINLQAIGIDADRSRKILSQFGNAVASVGKGKAEFERAIYGVQQLANTDFPLGEDLNIIKDALPQVSNLLKEAFGSSRSDELAKMGVSSKQVLDTITAGLEKLPRVTGGINGAFENLGDSMKTSLARIGKIIDDTFDISGIIDKLTGYLDSAVSAFENLSPAVQKSILVVTGLVAAAGPLLVVVGGFIAALPTMLTGIGAIGTALTALTGPIGLVVVGIAAIIAAVVSNWGKIKPYIINTINYFRDLYNESIVVRGAVVGLTTMFRNSFAIISNILKTAWEIFKTFAKATADLFAGVGEVIKGALTGDVGAIQSGLAKIAAAWSIGMANLGKDLENGIKGLYNDIKRNFSDGLNEVVNGGKLKPITDIKLFDEEKISDKTSESVTNGVTKGIKKAKDKIKEEKIDLPEIKIVLPELTDSQMLDNWVTDYIGNKSSQISDTIAADVQAIADNKQKLIDAATKASADIKAANDQIMQDFVAGELFNFGAVIGDALASGVNVIQAAGSAILGSLGQFAVMLGKELVKLGTETVVLGTLIEAIKKWAIANPYIAIAAGVAAIAVGDALSKSASNSMSNISNGGGGYSSGGLSTGAGGGVANYTSSYSTGTGSNNEFRFVIMGDDLYSVMERAKAKHERLN